MDALETADRTQPTEVAAKTERLCEKIDKLREQMRNLDRTAESLQSVNLITIQDLKEADVRAIWNLVGASHELRPGTVAWSFEGNGIRTRATFIQTFRE